MSTSTQESRRYVIYKLTSPSGKKYIGQTKNLKARLRGHRWPSKKNNLLIAQEVKLFGFKLFEVEVLWYCEDSSEADELEISYIKKFNTLTPFGLNAMPGGKKSEVPEMVRRKISDVCTGRDFSEEHRKNLSIAAKKRIYDDGIRKKFSDSHKGTTLSEKHKENISNGLKGRPVSLETRKKIAESNRITYQRRILEKQEKQDVG